MAFELSFKHVRSVETGQAGRAVTPRALLL